MCAVAKGLVQEVWLGGSGGSISRFNQTDLCARKPLIAHGGKDILDMLFIEDVWTCAMDGRVHVRDSRTAEVLNKDISMDWTFSVLHANCVSVHI